MDRATAVDNLRKILERTEGFFIRIDMESSAYTQVTLDIFEVLWDQGYRNIGVVVGKSQSMLTPNGQRVPSALEYGQVVLFQKRAVVGEMAIAKEPYLGRKLIILSERNIVCRLPAVPFKILDEEIGAESFPQLQPEDK